MFGNGFSGILLNIFRAICLVAFPPSSDDDNQNNYYGALIYFSLAAVILIGCIIGYIFFSRLPFVLYHMNKVNKERVKTERRISGVDGDIDDATTLLSGKDINKSNNFNSIKDQSPKVAEPVK